MTGHPLPLIQVLLPHLRVSRGASGLARSARARQRFYETLRGYRPVNLRSHMLWNERLCFRTYGCGEVPLTAPGRRPRSVQWPSRNQNVMADDSVQRDDRFDKNHYFDSKAR